MVGTVSVLVDLVVYRLISSAVGWRMDIAKGISYWAGVAVGFVGNKVWTFESSRRSLREPISYVALYAVTMVVNIACNRAVWAVLGGDAVTIPFLFATGVTTVLNFLGMKFFTFRQGVEDRRCDDRCNFAQATLSERRAA